MSHSPPISSPAAWIIRPDELNLVQNIQTGGQIQGRWQNRLVMARILRKGEANALSERGELWHSMRHRNVVEVLGVSSFDADPQYVVTPFHPNGNVVRYLERNPDVDRANIILDAALGMQYLHARKLAHGSLKPANILIADDGRACIADCGMAEIHSSGSEGHRYFSPEAWKGTLSRSSDVFAWAMSALEIYSGRPPWGILSEKQIFRLVVREDSRPDRPDDEDYGLTDDIWNILEDCWRESRSRPTFDKIVQRLQNRGRVAIESLQTSSMSGYQEDTDTQSVASGSTLGSIATPAVSLQQHRLGYSSSILKRASGPPAYEPTFTDAHPDSAPPTILQFKKPMRPNEYEVHVRPQHTGYASEGSARPYGHRDEDGITPMFQNSMNLSAPRPRSPDQRPPLSVRTTSSSGSSRTRNPHNFRSAPPISEEPYSPVPEHYRSPPKLGSGYLRQTPSMSTLQSSDTCSTLIPSPYAGSIMSQPSKDGSSGTQNAKLLAGALLTEVRDGRKRDVIDNYLGKIQNLGLRSHKEAQKLITAGTVATLILLLRTRAVDGIGLEAVLITLGILSHDPISANMVSRTSTSTTLIEIFDASPSDSDVAALAVWCLSRICRSPEVANSLLKQNLGKLLVTKGLKGAPMTSRMAAWCIGALIQSDNIAEVLAEMGFIPVLCDHMRDCVDSTYTTPDDNSAAIFAVARLSRSVKIAKGLAKCGCINLLAHHLTNAEDPRVLLWSARAVGCLMRPNSSDMAKLLLDAGIARGLARLPSVLPTEEVEPLASFAFAIQRFSCAEWGGGTRKVLVDAGAIDSLLAALRTAADEPFPQVHIELAYAITLLGDVGGAAIRKEIINAGGIDILKRVAASAARPDVTKACNIATTSITGNVWSRNTASAKAALAHEWTGGCPDYQPACPLPITDTEPTKAADTW
ncbi:hypothetical protein C8J57DRAFT_1515160 [Mycena rebaudengoi]|nr:hypothetical protein C8J57DRAFT_1515160 [Mycena rebaudengoi]